ncbi:MAG TPA: hypothetical protein VI685_03430 [Candidatus Angelobacter sp.]
MTLHLKPEIAAALEALANAQGISVEDYLQQLVERELPVKDMDAAPSGDDGMVWENGLFVYRTGKPLPSHIITDAVRRSRDKRSEHILGDLS